jgi:hypothetical protein
MVILKKYQASTLIESLVSMVIITLAFSISLTIYLNLAKTSNPILKLKAFVIANKAYQNLDLNEINENMNYIEDGLQIDLSYSPYTGNKDIQLMTITISDTRGRILLSRKELVPFNHLIE